MSAPVLGAIGGTWPYVTASWIFVFGSIGVFAVATVVRGRRLSRRVPPERRRWS
jgi:hypothetical protein